MPNLTTFSQKVKAELCRNKYDARRLKPLLAAFVRLNGTVLFRKKKSSLVLTTKNAKIARFIYTSLKDMYEADAHLKFLKNRQKKNTYVIEINDDADKIIADLKISFFEGKIPKEMIRDETMIAGYLTGAFLAVGSINSPTTSNYHLELAVTSDNYAKWIGHLFTRFKTILLSPKITHRREKTIVYFKKSEQIANFLIVIGAVEACMEFESVRVDRDYVNVANRLTNLDTANMAKVDSASKRQIKEINVIKEKLGLDNIANEKVRLLCEMRLNNESSSLADLTRLYEEKVHQKISKSNVNHIFRFVHQLYLKLTGQLPIITPSQE